VVERRRHLHYFRREKKAFKLLQTDEERESFIEQFWLRRDPSPDTEENEYREEHYRRIAYANDNFASGIPDGKSDRGMIYIKYGAPDERDQHNAAPTARDSGRRRHHVDVSLREVALPYIDGIGTNVEIEFVDTTMTGEFHMTSDPSEKTL